MLRFLTAGESHGPALVAIIEGLPAGLPLDPGQVNARLRRRQGGYGRGGRQQIERDAVRFQSGLYQGKTIGSPLAMLVPNRDYENWREREIPPWTRPRPGHADLAGGVKYGLDDMRLVAERASARETAARVAVGGVAAVLLEAVGVRVGSYVASIGGVRANLEELSPEECMELALASDVSCPDAEAAVLMRARIDQARAEGDSLGGVFDVVALDLPVGLGSHVHWDRRLDGLLAQALMSIQAIKGVEIGDAFANADRPGTRVHDPIYATDRRLERRSNRAGGLEGGISNGEPIVARAAMKPIPTTISPIATVDMATGKDTTTQYTRSDVCAVPAAAVVGEAMMAWVLAQALVERYASDRFDRLVEEVARDCQ